MHTLSCFRPAQGRASGPAAGMARRLRRCAVLVALPLALAGCIEGVESFDSTLHIRADGSLHAQLALQIAAEAETDLGGLQELMMNMGSGSFGRFVQDIGVRRMPDGRAVAQINALVPGNVAVGLQVREILDAGREVLRPDVWRITLAEWQAVDTHWAGDAPESPVHTICLRVDAPWRVAEITDPNLVLERQRDGRLCTSRTDRDTHPQTEIVVARGDTPAWAMQANGAGRDFPDIAQPVVLPDPHPRTACLARPDDSCLRELLDAERQRAARAHRTWGQMIVREQGRMVLRRGLPDQAETILRGMDTGAAQVDLAVELMRHHIRAGDEDAADRHLAQIVQAIRDTRQEGIRNSMIFAAAAAVAELRPELPVAAFLAQFDAGPAEHQPALLAVVLARHGRTDEALALAPDAAARLRVHAHAARALWTAGAAEAATAMIDPALAEASQSAPPEVLADLAGALAAMGRIAAAEEVLDRLAPATPLRLSVLRAVLVARHSAGDRRGFRQQFAQFVAELAAMENDWQRSTAAVGLVEGLILAGDPDMADQLLPELHPHMVAYAREWAQLYFLTAERQAGDLAAAARRSARIDHPLLAAMAMARLLTPSDNDG